MTRDWERFVRGEPAGDELPPRILASWQRSRDAGVDPHRPVFHRVADLDERIARARVLLEVARPHLGWLSATLAIDHTVYLVDRDGVVLDARGSSPELLDRAQLIPGVDWSERRMGTSGAGTSLAIGEPIAVLGDHHYCRAWHDTACCGSPVRAPGGAVIGAIDLTTSLAQGHRAHLLAVRHIVYAIEHELALRQAVSEERVSRTRAERLRDALSSFSRALAPDEVARALCAEGLADVGIQSAAAYVLEGSALERAHAMGVPDDALARDAAVDLDGELPLAVAARTGAELWLPATGDPACPCRDPVRGHCPRAALPLQVGGRTIGALAICIGDRPALPEDELRRSLRDLADHCAVALERARLYAAERASRVRAELAIRRREELLATVSHHLRTPLALVTTSTAILEQLIEAASPGWTDALTHTHQIAMATERMATLVRNLLDAERLDGALVAPALGEHSLSELLDAAVAAFAPLARRREQHLAVDAEPSLVIRCDRELTLQVLWNLLENALDFAPEGSTIELRARRAGSSAHVCVIDRGPGIDPAALPHIFERHFQDRPRSRTGLGLGLFIARAFLEAQGGTIRAASQPGHGSELCFEVPLAAAASAGAGAGD